MDILSTLATGNGSKVKKAIYNGKVCAIKSISKSAKPLAQISKEVKIHKSLSHPNIIEYLNDFGDQDFHSIIMEYGPYSLRNLIVPEMGMRPALAHMFFVQLVAAVKYLHSRNICHRDIKPDNILLGKDGNLKLGDFGHSTLFIYKEPRRLKSIAGSYEFMAPEVFKEDYDGQACDIWSCGITLINMLTGKLPWDRARADDERYRAYKRLAYHQYDPFDKVREQTLVLIKSMLRPENSRINLDGIEKNAWYRQENALIGTDGKCRDPGFLEGLEEVDIPSCYTQPDELKKNMCFVNNSLPIQKSDLPNIYRFYMQGPAEEAIKCLKRVLENMAVLFDPNHRSIAFSTVDTKRNRLNGEIVVQETGGDCFVTVKKTRGDLQEFQKFIYCINSEFLEN